MIDLRLGEMFGALSFRHALPYHWQSHFAGLIIRFEDKRHVFQGAYERHRP